MRAVRLHDRPIFTPDLHPSIGRNIPGPSAIRVPDWTAHWLGITISISPITGPLHSARLRRSARRTLDDSSARQLATRKILFPDRASKGYDDRVCIRTVARRLGEHNAEIFGRLGVSEADLQELQIRDVF